MKKHTKAYSASFARVFQNTLRSFYKKEGRHTLPWRRTRDPYKILVSEVMLQQTQVSRVVEFYTKFTKCFPTVDALARAHLSEVLKVWQGLGYNRRAKMLHDAAKTVVAEHNGRIPRSYTELLGLRGVGEYTAKAVRVFAWNEPEVLIETNVRTVFIHHFFPKKKSVADSDILVVVKQTLDTKNPREWYAGLMDYGAHLKRILPNPSRKSATHTKQKVFKGSNREVRGVIVRTLSQKPTAVTSLYALPFDRARIDQQLMALTKEGLIERRRARYQLPD